MIESPIVSVLLPVRNGEQYILESISSILWQSFTNWELIIIDNGSEDRTQELCESFQDRRIRFFRNPGQKTIATALNFGIDKSRGRFIARIDADDIALPQRLSKQVALLTRQPNTGLVGTWMRTFGERNTSWKYPVRNPDVQLAMLFSSPFGHPAVMFRKNWQSSSTGYYDSSFDLAEDYELWTRISRQWECENIPEELTLYRTHSGQSTKHQIQARESCVNRIRAEHHREHGLVPLSENPSLREFVAWWKTFKLVPMERSVFRGARYHHHIWRQATLLLRQRVKNFLQRSNVLKEVTQARNFLEKVPPRISRSRE